MKTVLIRLNAVHPAGSPLISMIRGIFPECDVRVLVGDSVIMRAPAVTSMHEADGRVITGGNMVRLIR